MTAIILLVIIVMIVVFVVGIYNGLVTSRNAYKNNFAQIDVQLQRRYDLIPNLVEVAKKYMAHERETLEAVIAARGAAMNGLAAAKANPGDPQAMAQLTGAENQLTATLGRLFAVAEAYPALKANKKMLKLRKGRPPPKTKVALARKP